MSQVENIHALNGTVYAKLKTTKSNLPSLPFITMRWSDVSEYIIAASYPAN